MLEKTANKKLKMAGETAILMTAVLVGEGQKKSATKGAERSVRTFRFDVRVPMDALRIALGATRWPQVVARLLILLFSARYRTIWLHMSVVFERSARLESTLRTPTVMCCLVVHDTFPTPTTECVRPSR